MICFFKCLHVCTIQCTVYGSRTIFKNGIFLKKNPTVDPELATAVETILNI